MLNYKSMHRSIFLSILVLSLCVNVIAQTNFLNIPDAYFGKHLHQTSQKYLLSGCFQIRALFWAEWPFQKMEKSFIMVLQGIGSILTAQALNK